MKKSMNPETKRQLVKFLWKLFTALLAAFGGATAAAAAAPTVLPMLGLD